MGFEPSRRLFLSTALGALGTSWAVALGQQQDPAPKAQETFPPPEPIPEVTLGPMLKTHPIQRNAQGFVNGVNGKAVFNERWIDASVLPRDKQGIWVLDFAFKPLRIITGRDPRQGAARRPLPLLPGDQQDGQAPDVRAAVHPGHRHRQAVRGHRPPPGGQADPAPRGPDDPEPLWRGGHHGDGPAKHQAGDRRRRLRRGGLGRGRPQGRQAHRSSSEGLSDGHREDPTPDGGKPVIRYKALQIDFIRRGDQLDQKEREITLGEPPYDWTYR